MPVLAFLEVSVLARARPGFAACTNCIGNVGSPSHTVLPPVISKRRPEQEEACTLLVFGRVSLARFLSGGLCRASRHRSSVTTPRLDNSSVSLWFIFLFELFFPWSGALSDNWRTAVG